MFIEYSVQIKSEHEMGNSWAEVLVDVLEELGGEARLSDIYKNVRGNPRGRDISRIKDLEANIRGALETHSSNSKKFRENDLFYMKNPEHRTGTWGLRSYKKSVINDNALEKAEKFDLGDDFKRFTSTTLTLREGQQEFRAALLKAYNKKCCVTGCSIEEALQASHIIPYYGRSSCNIANGLLLRADLYILFDAHLWTVCPESKRVSISKKLVGTEYEKYNQLKLNIVYASQEALRKHEAAFKNVEFSELEAA